MSGFLRVFRRPFRYRTENLVFVIIGLNALVYLAELFLPRLSVGSLLALYPPDVSRGALWQLATYMFVHDPRSMTRIIFNMLALFIFGTQVERRMGSREFILYYLCAGTLAGVFSYAVYALTGSARVLLMGASGAVFAVQLAFAVYFPNAVIRLWGILPLRAPVMVLVFTAIELVSMIAGFGGNIAHLTHLAGFGAGWLYFLARLDINPLRALFGR